MSEDMGVGMGMREGEEDSQDLLDVVLPVAKEQLLQQGHFHTYDGAITVSGETVEVAAREDGGEDL